MGKSRDKLFTEKKKKKKKKKKVIHQDLKIPVHAQKDPKMWYACIYIYTLPLTGTPQKILVKSLFGVGNLV